jgi:hypothetical protein
VPLVLRFNNHRKPIATLDHNPLPLRLAVTRLTLDASNLILN